MVVMLVDEMEELSESLLLDEVTLLAERFDFGLDEVFKFMVGIKAEILCNDNTCFITDWQRYRFALDYLE